VRDVSSKFMNDGDKKIVFCVWGNKGWAYFIRTLSLKGAVSGGDTKGQCKRKNVRFIRNK
jgi:hypothetical protein